MEGETGFNKTKASVKTLVIRNQPTLNTVNAYCSVEYSVAPQHGKSKQITKENIRI